MSGWLFYPIAGFCVATAAALVVGVGRPRHALLFLSCNALGIALLCALLGATCLSFVTFALELGDASGQGFAAFALIAGVLELVVGVGIVAALRRQRGSVSADDASRLHG